MEAIKNIRIVIAGGTGFIGSAIARYFEKDNEVVLLTRNSNKKIAKQYRMVQWDAQTLSGWVQELDGADLVINLTGESIQCRHTPANRKKILDSRIDATKAIGNAIRELAIPPSCWINASGISLYADGVPGDEYTRAFAGSFMASVVKQWEAVFFEAGDSGHTRKIALRLAVVLGDGGILEPYLNLVKFGLGGRQGTGKQMISWVHVADVCRIIAFLYQHKQLSGAFNACAPNPVTNAQFMQTMRKACGAPIGLPAYEWMVRAGAWMMGKEPSMILESNHALPARLIENGFVFRFPEITEALTDVIQGLPRNRYRLF